MLLFGLIKVSYTYQILFLRDFFAILLEYPFSTIINPYKYRHREALISDVSIVNRFSVNLQISAVY